MAGTVIGILGSPLPEGNTAKLLDAALRGAADAGCETEKIIVANMDYQPCMEMMFCKDHDTCIMDDDMQQVYGKIRNGHSRETEILHGPVPDLLHGKICPEDPAGGSGKEEGEERAVHLHLRHEDP
jgi:hypothetical protein